MKKQLLHTAATLEKEFKKMVLPFRFKLFCGFVLVIMILPIISACAGEQKDIPQPADSMRNTPDDDIILRAFEQSHTAIIAQVHQGALPDTFKAKADELKIGLKKYLIKTNADLQILEMDVLHASAAERKTALKKLMDLAAERERVKVQYLQRLQSFLPKNIEGSTTTPPPPAVPQSVESTTKDAGEKKSGTKWRTKDLDIEIEIAPEDISKGEHD